VKLAVKGSGVASPKFHHRAKVAAAQAALVAHAALDVNAGLLVPVKPA
jgi:hypothetical protein